MTAPVRTTESTTDTIEMGFYLPDTYDIDSAPRPTDGAIELVDVPERTLAVMSFSWYASEGRVERYERMLLSSLESRDIEPLGEPVLFRYNDPWTPPWMRTNEIAVEIDTE